MVIIIPKHPQVFKDIPAVDNNNAIVNFVENNPTDSFNVKAKIIPVKLEMMEQKMLT